MNIIETKILNNTFIRNYRYISVSVIPSNCTVKFKNNLSYTLIGYCDKFNDFAYIYERTSLYTFKKELVIKHGKYKLLYYPENSYIKIIKSDNFDYFIQCVIFNDNTKMLALIINKILLVQNINFYNDMLIPRDVVNILWYMLIDSYAARNLKNFNLL